MRLQHVPIIGLCKCSTPYCYLRLCLATHGACGLGVGCRCFGAQKVMFLNPAGNSWIIFSGHTNGDHVERSLKYEEKQNKTSTKDIFTSSFNTFNSQMSNRMGGTTKLDGLGPRPCISTVPLMHRPPSQWTFDTRCADDVCARHSFTICKNDDNGAFIMEWCSAPPLVPEQECECKWSFASRYKRECNLNRWIRPQKHFNIWIHSVEECSTKRVSSVWPVPSDGCCAKLQRELESCLTSHLCWSI